MATRRTSQEGNTRRLPPASTPEERDLQLQLLAYDLAEKQLRDGTASAQVITYFLKNNSVREQAELEKLRNENALTEAKVAAAGQGDRMEELLTNAMKAFTSYRGDVDDDEEYS